jgi:hypothetical protein
MIFLKFKCKLCFNYFSYFFLGDIKFSKILRFISAVRAASQSHVPFFFQGNDHPSIIINVSANVFLNLWQELILYFEKSFQNWVTYWTLAVPATGLFVGGMKPENISFLSSCGGGEKTITTGGSR